MSILKDEKTSILRLSAIQHGEINPDQKLTYIFGPAGGTVGRKDCAWTLKDNTGVMSRKHIEIKFRDDHYVILDHSTNGTYINGSLQKLGPGMEHQIVDGDRIEIGEYLLQASLEPEIRETSNEIFDDAADIGTPTDLGLMSGQSSPPFTEPKFDASIDLENTGTSFAKPPNWVKEENTTGEQILAFSPASTEYSDTNVEASILHHHHSPPRSVERHSTKSQGEEPTARSLDTPPTSFIPGGTDFPQFDESAAIPSRFEIQVSEIQDEPEIANESQDTNILMGQEGREALTRDQTQQGMRSVGVKKRHQYNCAIVNITKQR